MDLAWLLRGVSPKPKSHVGRGMLKKPPSVSDNNGAVQVRLRLDGRDHFINRLGHFDDPIAQARGQAICAEICLNLIQGDGYIPFGDSAFRVIAIDRSSHPV